MRTAIVVVVAVALLAGAGLTAWRLLERTPYHAALARYDADRGIPNRIVELPEGQARWAYGSPDRHRLVVQWRDPDGSGWTAPRTVASDAGDTAVDSMVRAAGGTVAIVQTWTSDVTDDQDASAFQVAMVCRDLACTSGRPIPGFTAEPQLTPDGRTVLFAEARTGAIVWTVEDGYAEWPWSGHPGVAPRRTTTTRAQLAADGSLRMVTSPNAPDRCVFTLLVSDPGTAALAPVATVKRRVHRPREESCGGYLAGGNVDRVRLVSDAGGKPIAVFVRTDAGWTGARG
ncbi:MAG: hypothetical protein R2731_07755 [Nocardioides sp.]